ncbi:ABC transporter ATP-binding protein [Cyclobacterium xiamenense]|uniref:ABC transporter ATP-binding protein n=1 Tax=Cyclobacterium xiamenense TaxID=1297121 RepID=UPI0035D0A2BA
MSRAVIEVNQLSKAYQIGQFNTGTLSKDLERWWITRVRGKEDPFLKVGEVNRRDKSGTSNVVWSLRDINFSIGQGEAVGIIGKNGAGKSTLLKLLSRVTAPTLGNIKVKGRIASLLEVGTGFHPELSGRENIYLNGAILGMRKREISRKLEEIVDFSGVERYIDTPVKRYSSGMYVRLAFAVAAHLESEILIVDEVLAVGDADFQKKCLGKMGEVSKGEGRTILFVSHNMTSVKALCTRAVLLTDGQVTMNQDVSSVITSYLHNRSSVPFESDFLRDSTIRRGNGEARFSEILINDGMESIDPTKEIRIQCTVKVESAIDSLFFSMMLRGRESSEPIGSSRMIPISNTNLEMGKIVSFKLFVPAGLLRTGMYPVYFWIGKPREIIGEHYPYDVVDSRFYLNCVSNKAESELGYDPSHPIGFFTIDTKIEKLNIDQYVVK